MLLGGAKIASIFRAKECQQPLLEQRVSDEGQTGSLVLSLSFLFEYVLISFVSSPTSDKTHQPLLNACWAVVP